MSRPPDDTDSVRLMLHALARRDGPVLVAELCEETGIGEGSVSSTASFARRRLRALPGALPGAGITGSGRHAGLYLELVGVDRDRLLALLGPPPLPLTYLGFKRSRAYVARTLVAARGEPVPAHRLALDAFPGSASRAAGLDRLSHAVSVMRGVLLERGASLGPTPGETEGVATYRWGRLVAADLSTTATETLGVRVSLAGAAGRYTFADGRLYRDGDRCRSDPA